MQLDDADVVKNLFFDTLIYL